MTAPIQSTVYRGSEIESVHQTSAVLIAPDRNIAYSAGDIDTRFPARSSIKAFQASALMLSGAYEKFEITDQSLALSCASHSGEDYHVSGVKAYMQAIGVGEADLMCGHHLPYNAEAGQTLFRTDAEFNQLTNNCSGKHTGFLAVAKALGADTSSYIDLDQPVQQMIAAQLAIWLGRSDWTTAVDGCSAPTFYLSLAELASLGRRLVSGTDPLLQNQLRAIQAYPEYVAGTGRFDTLFMQVLKGRSISKEGAEGVQMLAIVDSEGKSWGLALKVHDGSGRPREQVALKILERFGLITESELSTLASFVTTIYRNHRGLEVAAMTTALPSD